MKTLPKILTFSIDALPHVESDVAHELQRNVGKPQVLKEIDALASITLFMDAAQPTDGLESPMRRILAEPGERKSNIDTLIGMLMKGCE